MGLLTILRKMKQKEREVRLLMLYPFVNDWKSPTLPSACGGITVVMVAGKTPSCCINQQAAVILTAYLAQFSQTQTCLQKFLTQDPED